MRTERCPHQVRASKIHSGFRAWRYRLASAMLAVPLVLMSQAWAGPAIQSWHADGGANVLFVEAQNLPMVDIRIVFDAGSARDGGKPGLMKLTNSLLTQGAGPWDADEIARRMEAVGAELDAGSMRDMGWVSVRTLSEKTALDTAVDTLAMIIGRPNFVPEDFERQRERMLVALKRSEESPGSVAQKAFYAEVFDDHPYASYMGGTRESLSALTRDDVLAAYQRHYVAKNAVVAVVGALTRGEAEALVNRVVAKLAPGSAADDLPQVSPLTSRKLQRVDFPSTQTHIYVGQPGIRRGDEDYFPLYVGNHVLGGSGLVSLLSEEIREKRGLSYSVYSYFTPMRRPGVFLMGLQTKNEKAREALQVATDTVKRFIDQGPTEQQLDAAKKNLTGGFPLRIASNAQIVEYLAMIGFYDLPLDYLDTFTQKVQAVTAEQIRDAFSRRLTPQLFATVLVGAPPGDEPVIAGDPSAGSAPDGHAAE